ncbi:hypothetical protein AHT45_23810, partial [Salmonella enterica subsp. enterica serovar Paratyphi B]|nr:hypothetical protein [Salmonella enterica subsp. enterica serovar Paratyphi B]HCM4479960.1 ESPR domain-containing protein [Salmonella enterica subsp. enterica serovar Java]
MQLIEILAGIITMNKIYKLIFDKRRGELVVVSELTTGL